MDLLLLFFAIPLAVIILSIVLQKILNCPWLVAATFFAIFLVVTFAIGDIRLLIFAIIYTIIAYITALIFRFICETLNGNGIMFRNINAQNVNARKVNTNVLRANRIIDDDDDNEGNNNNCNNSSNCSCSRSWGYNGRTNMLNNRKYIR